MELKNQLLELFPGLTQQQIEKFEALQPLYTEWNEKINVISRKDLENFNERHLIHSLTIALYYTFLPNEKILDIGTGGGFPGIPLAILFPQTRFVLVDSIGKKIKVVEAIAQKLHLNNVESVNGRAENIAGLFDWVITRAVAPASTLWQWCSKKIKPNKKKGLIALKGGDLHEELYNFKNIAIQQNLFEKLRTPFFETKKVVFIPYQTT